MEDDVERPGGAESEPDLREVVKKAFRKYSKMDTGAERLRIVTSKRRILRQKRETVRFELGIQDSKDPAFQIVEDAVHKINREGEAPERVLEGLPPTLSPSVREIAFMERALGDAEERMLKDFKTWFSAALYERKKFIDPALMDDVLQDNRTVAISATSGTLFHVGRVRNQGKEDAARTQQAIEDECTFQPQISDKSKVIVSNNSARINTRDSVFNRLTRKRMIDQESIEAQSPAALLSTRNKAETTLAVKRKRLEQLQDRLNQLVNNDVPSVGAYSTRALFVTEEGSLQDKIDKLIDDINTLEGTIFDCDIALKQKPKVLEERSGARTRVGRSSTAASTARTTTATSEFSSRPRPEEFDDDVPPLSPVSKGREYNASVAGISEDQSYRPSGKANGAAARRLGPIVCYSCGRQFTVASLPRHLSQCPSNRATDMNLLPAGVRPPLAAAPAVPMPTEESSKEEVEAYNSAAQQTFSSHQPQCTSCGRRFEPDALLHHMRGCGDMPSDPPARNGRTGGGGARGEPKPGHPRTNNPSKRHIGFLQCYSCGQQYTAASLPRHLTVCPEERRVERNLLPEHLRPPTPPVMDIPVPTEHSSAEEVTDYNATAMEYFRAAQAMCSNCGRRFEPDALLRHLKGCKPKDRDGDGVPDQIARPPPPRANSRTAAAPSPGGRGAASPAPPRRPASQTRPVYDDTQPDAYNGIPYNDVGAADYNPRSASRTSAHFREQQQPSYGGMGYDDGLGEPTQVTPVPPKRASSGFQPIVYGGKGSPAPAASPASSRQSGASVHAATARASFPTGAAGMSFGGSAAQLGAYAAPLSHGGMSMNGFSAPLLGQTAVGGSASARPALVGGGGGGGVGALAQYSQMPSLSAMSQRSFGAPGFAGMQQMPLGGFGQAAPAPAAPDLGAFGMMPGGFGGVGSSGMGGMGGFGMPAYGMGGMQTQFGMMGMGAGGGMGQMGMGQGFGNYGMMGAAAPAPAAPTQAGHGAKQSSKPQDDSSDEGHAAPPPPKGSKNQPVGVLGLLHEQFKTAQYGDQLRRGRAPKARFVGELEEAL